MSPTPRARSRRTDRRPDDGVDHVVGFVLATGISIAAVLLLILSGKPYLDNAQGNVAHDSMVEELDRFDREVRSLIGGSLEGHTPAWRYGLHGGSLYLDATGHVWGYAVDTGTSSHRIQFLDFGDDDATVTIRNAGTGTINLNVVAYSWSGATSTTLGVSSPGLPDLVGAGDDEAVTLDTIASFHGHTVELLVYDDAATPPTTDPIARAWFVDVGALVWALDDQPRSLRVAYENGGLVEINGGQAVWHRDPQQLAPRPTTGNGQVVYLRLIELDGSLSGAGTGTGSSLLAHQGVRGRLSLQEVQRVTLYPAPAFDDAWETLLSDPDRALGYTVQRIDGTGPVIATVEPAGGGTLGAELAHANVLVTGGV